MGTSRNGSDIHDGRAANMTFTIFCGVQDAFLVKIRVNKQKQCASFSHSFVLFQRPPLWVLESRPHSSHSVLKGVSCFDEGQPAEWWNGSETRSREAGTHQNEPSELQGSAQKQSLYIRQPFSFPKEIYGV